MERYGAELDGGGAGAGRERDPPDAFPGGRLCGERSASSRDATACSIADEVGLGKTFLAGELIREAVHERRQRVLVVAPATLRDGPWRKFLLDTSSASSASRSRSSRTTRLSKYAA